MFMFRELILYINFTFIKNGNKSAGFYRALVIRYFNEEIDQLYFN